MVATVAVFTRDPTRVEHVRRLCEVAGVALDVCADVSALTARWAAATAVLIDAPLAGELLRTPPVRRPGVLLLAADIADLRVWQAATRLGAEQVAILPGDEQMLLDCLAVAAETTPTEGAVVGVVAACGGAGASTLAAAVGVAAAADRPAALVDLDFIGGGIDLLLGIERADGVRWPQLADVRGVVSGRALDDALPRCGELRVLSAGRSADPPSAESVAAVLSALRRTVPTVVVDLPRNSALTVDMVPRCDVLVLVVVAEVRAVAAAVSSFEVLRRHSRGVRLVVRVPARPRLRAGDVATALDLPVAATIPTDSALSVAADRGRLGAAVVRGGLGAAATVLLRDIGQPSYV